MGCGISCLIFPFESHVRYQTYGLVMLSTSSFQEWDRTSKGSMAALPVDPVEIAEAVRQNDKASSPSASKESSKNPSRSRSRSKSRHDSRASSRSKHKSHGLYIRFKPKSGGVFVTFDNGTKFPRMGNSDLRLCFQDI